jgi:DNA-binding IclR family transcriptional regulator
LAGNTSVPGASVASRTLALLFAFDEKHRRLTLTDLARRADLPVPTAHRLLAELVAGGALARRPSGEYVVGRRLWRVGLLAPTEAGLREVAEPFLNDIHAATRATVHLAVRDGDEVLYLDRVSGGVSVPVISRIGSRLPLHATGVGKVLLAHAPADARESYLANSLGAMTRHTVTDPTLLRQQLDAVRSNGFATTENEMTPGACSIAVPVFTRHLDDAASVSVIAALGVVVPTLKRDRARLVTAMQVAARGIERSLG